MPELTAWLSVAPGTPPYIVATIPGVPQPNGLAIHEPSNTLYVTSRSGSQVLLYDAVSLAAKTPSSIAVGALPFGLAIAGDRLYFANFGSDTVTVIDATTNTVAGTITLPATAHPCLIAVDPDGRVFVSLNGIGQVAVLRNGALDSFLSFGANTGPFGVAVDANPISHYLYVGLQNSQRVARVNLDTNSEAPRLYLPDPEAIPYSMTFNSYWGRLYVISRNKNSAITNQLSRLDRGSFGFTLVLTFDANTHGAMLPDVDIYGGIAASPDNTGQYYIGASGSNQIWVMRGANDTVSHAFTTFEGGDSAFINIPAPVAVHSTLLRTFVGNMRSNSITVIEDAEGIATATPTASNMPTNTYTPLPTNTMTLTPPGHPHRHSDPHGNCKPHRHCHPHRYAYRHRHTDGNANSDANEHANSHTNPDGHGDADTDAHAHPHVHLYTNANIDANHRPCGYGEAPGQANAARTIVADPTYRHAG